jgi:predicted MFS family arabinose efflux permease
VLAYSVFSGLCVFAHEPWHLGTLRFLAALGMGGEWSLGVALVMEVWPNRSRPLLAGLIGAAANVGFLLVGLLGLCLAKLMNALTGYVPDALLAGGGWRLLCLVAALPALLTFFIRVFVPESERWQQAFEPHVRLADAFTRETFLGTALATVALLGTWGSVQWIPLWTGRLTGGNGAAYAQISISIGAILGTVAVALLAEAFNRRRSFFLLSLLTTAACALLFRVPMNYGWTFILLVGVVGGLSSGFYGWLPLYLPELFPTRIRATAQGFAYNFGRVFAAAGTLAGGQLVSAFDGDYARMCSLISLVYLAGLALIWFCPETKDRPLPE